MTRSRPPPKCGIFHTFFLRDAVTSVKDFFIPSKNRIFIIIYLKSVYPTLSHRSQLMGTQLPGYHGYQRSNGGGF